MRHRRPMLATVLVIVLGAFAMAPAAAASTANSSPGACNMLHAGSNGLAGMDGSALGPGQGVGGPNMLQLVISSLGTGCAP